MSSVGYATLRIVPSLKGMAGEINRELNQQVAPAAKQMASRAGVDSAKQFAGEFADWSGKQLKRTMVGVGAAATGVLATSLVKGFGRLRAIDDARAKLTGLGHDAQSVAGIMDSALDSVRGTMFGLGEAASISATAVAAGVKPGEELTRYLKLIADTSTIAGVGLSEMGSIINKTTTDGRVFTMELRQLADRGIPIFTWLADSYGVSTEALRSMVEAGEVDAATFRKVIEENIGGAALAAGDSFSGAMSNAGHAAGRFGAVLLEDVFPLAQRFFNLTIEGFDALSDRVRPAMERITDTQIWRDLAGSIEGLPGLFDRAADAAEGFADAVVWLDDAPVLRRIGGDLATVAVSAAAAGGAWSLLTKAFAPATKAVNALRTALGLGAAATAGWFAVAAAGVPVAAEMGRQFRDADTFLERFMATVSVAFGPIAMIRQAISGWSAESRDASEAAAAAAAEATKSFTDMTPPTEHWAGLAAAHGAIAEEAAARSQVAAEEMAAGLAEQQQAAAEFLSDFTATAGDFMTGFTALPEETDSTMQEWIDNITSRTDAFGAFWDNIQTLQAGGLTGLADELIKEGPGSDAARTLAEQFVTELESGDKSLPWAAEQAARTAWRESQGIGKELMRGSAFGVDTYAWMLAAEVDQAVWRALRSGRNTAGIKSPSTVFRDAIGKPIGQGIAVGISSQFSAVTAATGGLVDGAMRAVVPQVRSLRIPVAGFDAPDLALAGGGGGRGYGDINIYNPTGEPSEESLVTAVLGLQVGGMLNGPA